MSLHWKMQTGFPFTRVFVLGIILFFLGLSSMVISIIAFVQESWGYYVGTGMWGGALILASGLSAVFTSRLKSLLSVKAFLIGSVMGVFASLTMLILSAGGLTVTSGFYGRIDASQYNKRTSNLIHASLLVIAVFCLSGNVLAIIVSCKYLFFETREKPPKHRRRHRHLVDGSMRTTSLLRGGAPQSNSTSRSSSTSRTVLLHVGPSSSRRHSDNTENSSNSNRVPIEYRRSHRRAGSEQSHVQSHVQSHSRRLRYGHECPQHHTSNMLSSNPTRRHDRRVCGHRSRSEEANDRMNIQPSRHAFHRDPNYPVRMQVALSNGPCSSSSAPKVRLPTEFNEEELPPYEPAEVSSRVVVGASSSGESPGDSGDESDTENSSSSDGHNSYDATPLCPEGTESVPMVVLTRPRRNNTSQQNNDHRSVTTTATVSNIDNRCVERLSGQSSSRTAASATTANAGSMIVRQDADNSTRPVMSFVDFSSPSSHLGDYESLLSVSSEIRAITGASPELNRQSNQSHDVEENFYENGPCYANIRQVGSNNVKKANKESVSRPKEEARSNPEGSKGSPTATDNPSTSRKVPVHVISSRVSSPPSSSIQSPRSSIGSNHSAFRPVGAVAVSPLSTHSVCSPTPHSPFALFSDSRDNSPFSSPRRKAPLSTMTETDADSLAEQYRQQGARPKSFNRNHHNELSDETVKDNANMSWKNIPLPLSYNHSECLCNDDEKLPPKSIPFADHGKPQPSISASSDLCSHAAESSYDRESERTVISKDSVPKSNSTTASPFGAAAEAMISPSSSNSKNATPQQPVSTAQSSNSSSGTITNSNSASASKSTNTDGLSVLSSIRPSHRMGGNQSLLQSRREALQNTHLSQRTLAGMAPLNGAGQRLANTGIKSLAPARNALDRDHRTSVEGVSASVDESNQQRPLSLNGYLVNSPNVSDHLPRTSTTSQANQQSSRQRVQGSVADQASGVQNNAGGHVGHSQPGGRQNGQVNQQAVRPNPFIHHYPIQPQQPRLGVQLQQRRQQQHQLQQNVELQQQQQLAAQANQQNQPPAQQQARNGRPLFSILL